MVVGAIVKLVPDRLEPRDEPPDGTVYQLIEAPTAIAFKLVVDPEQIILGVAVTDVGVGH